MVIIHLIHHIMKSKDALTGCTLEICRMIEVDPQGWKILGSTKSVRALALNLDSKAKDLRNATLAALVATWRSSGKSQSDFVDKVVVGGGKSLSGVSSKGIDMLRNRLAAVGSASAPSSSAPSADRPQAEAERTASAERLGGETRERRRENLDHIRGPAAAGEPVVRDRQAAARTY